ncbi:hypothetical protein [Thiorhodococcus fuscus]|uniref:Uncharacterized protein n=1 Tax=Thiorhodococcus fuscus TaxID=527200 RepID=A0ABW4Y7A5_9GAMM
MYRKKATKPPVDLGLVRIAVQASRRALERNGLTTREAKQAARRTASLMGRGMSAAMAISQIERGNRPNRGRHSSGTTGPEAA